MPGIKRHHGDKLLLATLIVGMALLVIALSLPYVMDWSTGTAAFTAKYGCAKCAPGAICPDICIAPPAQYASTILAMHLLRLILLIAALIMIVLPIAVKFAAHFKK
jgi:hypothetical protein